MHDVVDVLVVAADLFASADRRRRRTLGLRVGNGQDGTQLLLLLLLLLRYGGRRDGTGASSVGEEPFAHADCCRSSVVSHVRGDVRVQEH